jgi:AraC-like DNA-binding protein
MIFGFTDFLLGSLALFIMTLGSFYFLQAVFVYRSYRHESFAFAGMALFFGLYLLIQLVAFRMEAVRSLPLLRMKMITLGILLSFWISCAGRIVDPDKGAGRWLPLLPLIPLISTPFDFYLTLPVRLELIGFFGHVLPYRTASAGPGFFIHLLAVLTAGVFLFVKLIIRRRDLFRYPFFLYPVPFIAVVADILPGITRVRPLMFTEASLLLVFFLTVAHFIGRDREARQKLETRSLDLEQELDDARTELSRYRNSSLTEEQAGEGLSVLTRLMEHDRVYLDHFLTLGGLARKTGLSVHHLSQLINDRTGMNFNQYVNRYRVEEACRLLGDPLRRHLTMEQVSEKAGFNSLSVFNTLFKKHTSLTPSAWRSRNCHD